MRKLLLLAMSFMVLFGNNSCQGNESTPQEERFLEMFMETITSTLKIFKENGISDFNELYVGRYLTSKSPADLALDKRYIALYKRLGEESTPLFKELKDYYTKNKKQIRFSQVDFTTLGCPLGSIDAVLNLFTGYSQVYLNFVQQLELLYKRVEADTENKFELDPKDKSLLEAHEYMISNKPEFKKDRDMVRYFDKYFRKWIKLFNKSLSLLQDDFRTAEYVTARNNYIKYSVTTLRETNVSLQWLANYMEVMQQLSETEDNEANSSVKGASSKAKNNAHQTVNGAQLPNTSSSFPIWSMLGFIAMFSGFWSTRGKRFN